MDIGRCVMISLITCKNGHRYDPALTPECPMCATFNSNIPLVDEMIKIPYPEPRTILEEKELPVAWLLGVRGFARGDSYHIHSGENKVGVPLGFNGIHLMDQSVCARSHCSIFYDEKDHACYIWPVNGMIYLNEKPVVSRQRVGRGDSIRIGAGTFVIIPLCGENFSWDNWPDATSATSRERTVFPNETGNGGYG